MFRVIRENRETIALLDQTGIQQRYLFSGKSITELLYPAKNSEIKYVHLAAEAPVKTKWLPDSIYGGIDMKRKTAKEILAASFQELAAVKSIDKITIQEIAEVYEQSIPEPLKRYLL